MTTIDAFFREYRFLSNFYPVKVKLDGEVYPSVEHAYQAAKTNDPATRKRIRLVEKPGDAKHLGRTSKNLRPDWEQQKESVMLDLLRQKFAKDELRDKLFRTGEAELVEGNTWNDTYWGVCAGKGKNRLGHLLMQVRAENNASAPG